MSDTIYRQDAIDSISTWDKFGIDERNRVVRWHEGLEPYVKLRDVVWAIEKMPSAEPEQKKGKWIYQTKFGRIECEACGHVFRGYVYPRNFCPNCGARMVNE